MQLGTVLQLEIEAPREAQAEEHSLELLPTIEPWGKSFRRNLIDLLLLRDVPRVFDRRRYEGWHTAYVHTGAPWTRIRESWWGHALLATATFAICTSPFLIPRVKAVSPFAHAHLQYVPVSEYLPAINHSAPRARSERPPDPVLAKQEIISVRPNADNHTQTIVAPPKMKLDHDVPLPNIAAWTAEPIAPTVNAPSARPKMIAPLDVQVVQPTPDVNRLHDRRELTLQSSVVEPIADDQNLRRLGDLNIANLRPDVVAPAPKLPMQTQKASGLAAVVVPPAPNVTSAAKRDGKGAESALQPQVVPPTAASPAMARGKTTDGLQPQVVPPQPSVTALAGATGGMPGQFIALNVRPADIHGPIAVPAGNRNGEFAAGPNGKTNATGQPESAHDSHDNIGGTGKDTADKSGPAGVYVAAPPSATTSNVAGKPAELAKMQFPKMHATVSEIAKNTKPSATAPESRSVLADKVFGDKRYYSLTLNMPNLNSATGSWVVRFAELNEKHDGIPVAAPVATNKIDPIYPQELVRDRVEGTVTLYAVIRQDGTVGEIRVLKGVDSLLDSSAMRALAGWKFQPGTKNGSAVNLEAIVDIPFRLKPLDF